MKQKKFWKNIAAALLLIGGAGCHFQENFSRVADEIPPPASETEQARRADAFRKVWEKLPVRAIQTSYQTLSPYDKMKPERFIAKLQKLGCNLLVITIQPETDLHWNPLKEIVKAAGKAKIKVCFELEQKDYSLTYRGNRLIRGCFFWRMTLLKKCAEIERFNRSLPREAKLSGIILTAQPDYFSDSNRKDRPKALLFTWSPDHYGIGLSNDAIVQYTTKSFRECVVKGSKNLPYLFTIPDFLHDAAQQKKLSQGTVADFARLSNHPDREVFLNLQIRVKGNKLDFSGADRELTDAGGKIVISIDISPHQAVTDGDLPRRSWNNMVRTARFCIRKWQKTPNFHGVMLGSWQVLQSMLGEL